MIAPFLWMIFSSFKINAEITAIPPTLFPREFTLDNVVMVWKKFNFAVFFRNSLFIAVLKTALVLYTSSLAGYVLDKIRFRGRNALFIMILATMMVPWPVSIIPLYQEMVWLKWLGSYKSLIIPTIMSSFGIFMMRQSVQSIPTALVEAARVDGTPEFGIFHKIILPNLGSSLSALGIFTFLWSWDDFLWPYLMINDQKLYTLPVGLALFSGQYYNDYAGVLAGASIAVIPVLIVFIIFQKKFIEGIATTGLKG